MAAEKPRERQGLKVWVEILRRWVIEVDIWARRSQRTASRPPAETLSIARWRTHSDRRLLFFDVARNEDDNSRHGKLKLFAVLRELAHEFDDCLTPGELVHTETGKKISPYPGRSRTSA